jgi:uncharacterized surface protein with fasciclin (FAS1) repeats
MIAALVLLVVCGGTLASAAGNGTFTLSNANASPGENGVTTLSLNASWEPPASDIWLNVEYDPAVIQYESTRFLVGGTVSATRTKAGNVLIQLVEPIDGYRTGPIAELTFSGLRNGSSPLGIELDHVRNYPVSRPVEIMGSAMVVDGRFDVPAPVAETPTPTTLQPTATPTPPSTTFPSTIARTPKPSITILYGDDYTGVVSPTKTIAPTGAGNQTIAVILENNPNFSMFLNATLVAGMTENLDGPGPLTAFIPTNSAFDALPPGTLDDLIKNRTALVRLVNYHLAPETLTIANVTTQASVKTLNGEPLLVNIRPGGAVGIDGANLTLLDIPTSNGMVHIVDSVMIPPGLIPVTTSTTIAIPSTTKPEGTSVLVTRAGPSGALVTMEVLAVIGLLCLRRRR